MRNLERGKKKIDLLREKWGKREWVDYKVLCRTLNREFKSLHVIFKFKTSKYFLEQRPIPTSYYVEAYYDNRVPGVSTDEPLYEIIITREKPRKKFLVDKWFWDEIYLILAHEFMHARQYKTRRGRVIYRKNRRGLNTRADQYLCLYDEIDAHAFEAATEIKMKGTPMLKNRVVQKYHKATRRQANPEWRRFIKRVHKYITQQ